MIQWWIVLLNLLARDHKTEINLLIFMRKDYNNLEFKPLPEGFNNLTAEVDSDIDTLLKVGRIQSKEEALIVKTIYTRFNKMKKHRENSCPWGKSTFVYQNVEDSNGEMTRANGTSQGKDNWENRWQRDRDLAQMRTGRNKFDSDLPDVSSPMVLSAAQAYISQFKDSHLSVMIEPNEMADSIMAKIAKAVIDDIDLNGGVEKTDKDLVVPEAVVCGTSITYNGYFCKKRSVKIIKTIDDLMEEAGFNDEAMEGLSQMADPMTGELIEIDPQIIYQQKQDELVAQIKKDPKKMLLSEKMMIDYEGVSTEFVPLEEMFIDPMAWDFNSMSRDARDCIWRQYVPVQQVYNEYLNSNDPFVIKKNLNDDLIISSSSSSQFYNAEMTKMSFTFDTISNEDLVCLVKYYNKYTDQYIVIANDIVIRDGVLPYNHKLLPFSKYIFQPLPNSFYGIGLGTLLDTTQTTAELFESLQSFLAERNANQPISTFGDNVNEVMTNLMEGNKPLKAGSIIKLEATESIMPLQFGQIGVDVDKVQGKLQSNAVLIAGVNPQQIAIPNANLAVRTAQMSSESGLLTMRAVFQNIGNGKLDTYKQLLLIIKQLEPTRYEEIEGEIEEGSQNPEVKKQLKKYRSVKAQLEAKDPEQEVELTPEVTNTFDKLKITMRVETTQLASRQLQASNLQEAMNTAMAIRSNPALKDDKIVKMFFREYLEKKGISQKVLSLLESEESEQENELADVQNLLMKSGQNIESIAGMSENHMSKHTAFLLELYTERDNLDMEATQLDTGQLNPDMAQDEMQFLQEMAAARDKVTKTIEILSKHLIGDMQAKTEANVAAVTMGQQQPASQPPQGQPQPGPMEGQPNEMPMDPMAQMGQV